MAGVRSDRYSMSFSTGTLLHRESVNLAALYLDLGDWTAVRQQAIEENLLQSRTLNTLRRVFQEVASRLKTLTPSELAFLVEASHQEQAWLLWIAVCRRYRFIADFAVEVLRERCITLQADLNHENFDAFFHEKAEWRPELNAISPATRAKLRQVLFKMLREADLLTADNMIKTAIPTPELLAALPPDKRRNVLYFPVFESDLQR